MRCRYIATYVAYEIALPADVASVELYSNSSQGVTATLVREPVGLLVHADTGAALINLMLRGVFGSSD